jgi:hypothetical protein
MHRIQNAGERHSTHAKPISLFVSNNHPHQVQILGSVIQGIVPGSAPSHPYRSFVPEVPLRSSNEQRLALPRPRGNLPKGSSTVE